MAFLSLACSPARWIPPGEQWVAREPQLRRNILPETPPLYLRSNSRLLGLPLSLYFYRMGQLLLEEEKPPWTLLRRIPKVRYYAYALGYTLKERLGEPPALLSRKALEQDIRLLEEAYLREGYFQAAIQPQVKVLRAPRVQVIYQVRPGPRWHIRELSLEGGDSTANEIAAQFLKTQMLPVGEPFRLTQLDALREALHQKLLSEGYYGLPLSAILLEVDTTETPPNARKTQGILYRWIGSRKNDQPTCAVRILLPSDLRRYIYASTGLYVHIPDRNPDHSEAWQGITFLTEPQAEAIIQPRVLGNHLFLPPTRFFDQRAVQASQRSLQSLECIQWVSPSIQETGKDSLQIQYEVVLRPVIDFAVGIEGFQSTQPLLGNLALPGASANLRAAHLSLFRRGWSLKVRGQASLSYFQQQSGVPPRLLYSLSSDATLTLPARTLNLKQAAPRPLPSTLTQQQHILLLAYQDIRFVEFARRYATLSWSRQTRYLFQDRRQEEQIWTPLSFTFVSSQFSQAFEAQIEALSPLVRSLILRDYLPRLTQLTSWQVSSNRNYFGSQRGQGDFSSLLIEAGGWLPFFVEHFLALTRPAWDSSYRDNLLFNRYRYGVFVRALGEVRWRKTLLPSQQLHLRGRLGIGQGLFYTIDVPFENRFFVGGPNSMRAWQFGALGPGSYRFPQNLFLIPGGTLLFEANAELRQHLFRGIQLAPFVDVGNVWFPQATNFEDPRGIFRHKPLPAIGAGVGLRWDFSILVIRLDLAQQIFEPATGWVGKDFPVGGSRSQYVFAVGYPF
uniref:Hypothetical conserved protein n=1 Tax=uncultured Bacteroidota bacterium TaxID=152509 RepID=H5SMU1_9BACT|nr:hypothetical conserved protein [uncultured Bacteroidetes bacterium]